MLDIWLLYGRLRPLVILLQIWIHLLRLIIQFFVVVNVSIRWKIKWAPNDNLARRMFRWSLVSAHQTWFPSFRSIALGSLYTLRTRRFRKKWWLSGVWRFWFITILARMKHFWHISRKPYLISCILVRETRWQHWGSQDLFQLLLICLLYHLINIVSCRIERWRNDFLIKGLIY